MNRSNPYRAIIVSLLSGDMTDDDYDPEGMDQDDPVERYPDGEFDL